MAFPSPHQTSFLHSDHSTPPPPPPKPSAHSSGRGTPSTGAPPLPPPPPSAQPASPHGQVAPFPEPAHESRAVPPPPDGWLPAILKDKPTSDLLPVAQSAALQRALVHAPATTHPSLPASIVPLNDLLAANVRLAQQLTALEAHLRNLRASTQTRLLSLKALERQWAAKQSEQDAALEPFGPRTLYQRLSAAVAEQESMCRGIEESWIEERGLADEADVADWVRRMREARKVAWLRRERRERWDEGRVGGWR